jgi:hypothetical protein
MAALGVEAPAERSRECGTLALHCASALRVTRCPALVRRQEGIGVSQQGYRRQPDQNGVQVGQEPTVGRFLLGIRFTS